MLPFLNLKKVYKNRTKLLWILSGDETKPSSRIHGINIHKILNGEFDSRIIFKPNKSVTDIDSTALAKCKNILLRLKKGVLIVQKLKGDNALELIEFAKKSGYFVNFLDCDYPLKLNFAQSANQTLVTSNYLKNLYEKEGINKINYVKEPYEYSKKPVNRSGGPLNLVWFGMPGKSKWESFLHIKDLVNSNFGSKVKILSISYNAESDIKWQGIKTLKSLNQYDISLVPMIYEGHQENAKSPNRIIQSMALGLPSLASPIPSYLEVIDHGNNGFICYKDEDWLKSIDLILSEGKLIELKNEAYNYALINFNPETVSNQWQNILNSEIF